MLQLLQVDKFSICSVLWIFCLRCIEGIFGFLQWYVLSECFQYIYVIVFVRVISFPLLFWVIGGGSLVGLVVSLELAFSC